MEANNFFRGGGSRPNGQKTVWTTGKLYFSKGPDGVQHLSRVNTGSNIFQGGPTFSRRVEGGGGVQMLISVATHITCDFSGGPDPLSLSGSAHGLLRTQWLYSLIINTLHAGYFFMIFVVCRNYFFQIFFNQFMPNGISVSYQ